MRKQLMVFLVVAQLGSGMAFSGENSSPGLLGDPNGPGTTRTKALGKPVSTAASRKLAEGLVPAVKTWKTWRVPGFVPARDVPAMKNWAPLANVEGAAHCFAISLMTTLFNKRILFTRDRAHKRVKLDKSWGRGDLKKRILETDEIGLHLIFEYLTTYDDGGRLQVGGFEGLQAFTSPGAIGEEFFLRNSEAIQFLLQIVAMGHRYAGTLIFSNLGSLPFSNVDDKLDEAGRKAILRRAYGKIKERIQEEELAPFTMHPSKIATDGHVIVAYKVRESGDQAELHCYDSNYPPEQGKARPTIVHLDLAEGTYRVLNHKGEKKYTRYDLLTFIDPNGRVIRHLARETVQHLDKATEATNLFYATLEVASRKGLTPLRNQEFVEDWKKTKERFKKNSTRRVRWSINFSR